MSDPFSVDRGYGVVGVSERHSYCTRHRLSAAEAQRVASMCAEMEDSPPDYRYEVWPHERIVAAGLLLPLFTPERLAEAQAGPIELVPDIRLHLAPADYPITKWEARLWVKGVYCTPASRYALPEQLAELEQGLKRNGAYAMAYARAQEREVA